MPEFVHVDELLLGLRSLPTDVVAKLDEWHQGHLIQYGHLFWGNSSAAQDVLFQAPGAEELTTLAWSPVTDPGLRAEWGVVTSQTCDIAATGAGANTPWVQISPVMRLPDNWTPNKINSLNNYGIKYLFPMSLASGAQLYADLRISLPVSKMLLATSSPIEGLPSERARLNFAEHLAARLRRPALHDSLSEKLRRSLDEHLKTAGKKDSPEWREKVEQVRLSVSSGDRLAPQSVRLIICEEIPLTCAERELWRSWRRQGRRLLADDKIQLQSHLFTSLDKLPARTYAESVGLALENLGRPRVW